MSRCWADTMGLTSRGVELKGWTRTTANSKQALLSGERAGLRIPAQLRTQWALMTDSRPAITQGGRNFGDRERIHGQRARSSLTLRYAGSPRRPQFALCGFSWHCALGERASACFSNSPRGDEAVLYSSVEAKLSHRLQTIRTTGGRQL